MLLLTFGAAETPADTHHQAADKERRSGAQPQDHEHAGSCCGNHSNDHNDDDNNTTTTTHVACNFGGRLKSTVKNLSEGKNGEGGRYRIASKRPQNSKRRGKRNDPEDDEKGAWPCSDGSSKQGRTGEERIQVLRFINWNVCFIVMQFKINTFITEENKKQTWQPRNKTFPLLYKNWRQNESQNEKSPASVCAHHSVPTRVWHEPWLDGGGGRVALSGTCRPGCRTTHVAAARPDASERRSSRVLVTAVVPSLCRLQVTVGGPSVVLAPPTSHVSWAGGRDWVVQFAWVSPVEGVVERVTWGVWGSTEDERGLMRTIFKIQDSLLPYRPRSDGMFFDFSPSKTNIQNQKNKRKNKSAVPLI